MAQTDPKQCLPEARCLLEGTINIFPSLDFMSQTSYCLGVHIHRKFSCLLPFSPISLLTELYSYYLSSFPNSVILHKLLPVRGPDNNSHHLVALMPTKAKRLASITRLIKAGHSQGSEMTHVFRFKSKGRADSDLGVGQARTGGDRAQKTS